MLLILNVVLLAVAAAIALAVFGVTRSGGVGSSPCSVSVRATLVGLPSGKQTKVFVVQPADGGGYHRKQVVTPTENGSFQAPCGMVIEAAPIVISDYERYYPTERFQPVPSGGGPLKFSFQQEYLVTVAKWSRGPATSLTLGQVEGTVSMDTKYVLAGTTLTISAAPSPGWTFLYWGLFAPGQPSDEVTKSSTANPLVLRVTAPIKLVAGFGPSS